MENFDMMTAYWLLGLVGVAFYLSAYTLLQAGLLRGSSVEYTLMNLTASCLVLISLAAEWNMSSALIQVSWITISVVGLTRLWMRTRALSFTKDEQIVRDACFATMPAMQARHMLDLGVWVEAPAGYVLTEEGMPVEHVYFVASGTVDVRVDGLKIAEVGPNGLIGEMGCLTHGAASATSIVSERTRMFRVQSDALAHLVRRMPDLGPHLEYAFAHATRQKLVQTNEALRVALHRVRGLDRAAG